MSELKKPYRPYAPSSYEYQERVERRYIYRFTETLLPEDSYDDESREVETPKKDIGEVDLGWLLTQIPQGVDPSQIKLEFGYNTSSMAYEDHYIRFYYNETIPKRTKEYNAAKKKYEEALAIPTRAAGS
jgi:hypothetical protein